jgi:hypothetical protein
MGYLLYLQAEFTQELKRHINGLCTKQGHLSAELEVGHQIERVGQFLSMSGTVPVQGRNTPLEL